MISPGNSPGSPRRRCRRRCRPCPGARRSLPWRRPRPRRRSFPVRRRVPRRPAPAREGKLDPVLGREAEIRSMIDILSRRRQNNPILTGEAGVGKTAVVEGFALKVAAGEVPAELANVAVRTLDLALLQAGAGVRG